MGTIISILATTLAFVLIFAILVIFHEWGHFVVARIFGIRVDEFSIGFGPRAIRLGQRGDTEYNIRWVPLGGYVKIAGMEGDEEPLLIARDRAMGKTDRSRDVDPNRGELPLVAENTPDSAETQAQRLRDSIDGFYSRSVGKRALVILAGPVMSFVLGYVLMCVLGLTIGISAPLPQVKVVVPHSEAQKIGILPGDRFTTVDGKPISSGIDLVNLIHRSAGRVLTFTIVRHGRTLTVKGTPRPSADDPKMGLLGFQPATYMTKMGVAESINIGNKVTLEWIRTVSALVTHPSARKLNGSIGGPIRIVSVVNAAVESDPGERLLNLVQITAELSMSLALFNLLPIPILDGGHIMMFALEAIRNGRRLTLQQQQNFMLTGLAIIGVLVVLVMFHDIHNLLPPAHKTH